MARWNVLDWLIAGYTALVTALLFVRWEHFSDPWRLLVWHAAIFVLLAVLPARGAAWEAFRPREGLISKGVRLWCRFLRYMYPLLLALFFFEEAQQTVLAVYPDEPFWFEEKLFAAERFLYGDLPINLLFADVNRPLDELMHFFYFSYYMIIVLGPAFAFFGTAWKPWPAPGFEAAITGCIASFLVAFVWYPYLPARGPWEQPELMAPLHEFRGPVFVPTIRAIISEGAVNGACFPSGHVAGAWGTVFGLARSYRRLAFVLAFIATGMSFSCVYTRYHHSLDVPAGFACALVGGWIAWRTGGSGADQSATVPRP